MADALHVVVAGGTGFLGSALVRGLRGDGHRVTVLTRRPGRPGEAPWPTGESGAAANPLDGASAVVNLAGASIASGRWTRSRKEEIRRSRTSSTRRLVEAIASARAKPSVLLSASAVGYYGTHGDEPLTEAAPAGADFLAKVGVEWEEEAMAAAVHGTRVVLLRTGLVLARDGGALPLLALPFRLFVGGPTGSGRQYMSWIHRDDWVSLVSWAMRTPSASGPFNLTAPEPVTNAVFARTLGGVLHRPAWLPAPAFALRLAMGEMADALALGGQRVVPAKALAQGFRFEYPSLEPALRNVFR